MNYLKQLFGFYHYSKGVQHNEQLTNFLKNNTHFKKVSITVFEKKRSTMDKLRNSLDDLLKEEDDLKFIEDKSKKNKNKTNKKL